MGHDRSEGNNSHESKIVFSSSFEEHYFLSGRKKTNFSILAIREREEKLYFAPTITKLVYFTTRESIIVFLSSFERYFSLLGEKSRALALERFARGRKSSTLLPL